MQSQISCYALRTNLERDAEEMRKARARMDEPELDQGAAARLDSTIERFAEMVDRVMEGR